MFFAWLVIFLPLLTLSLSLSLVIEFFCPFSVSRMNLEIEMDVIDIIKCHVEFSFFFVHVIIFFPSLSVVIPLIWYLKVFIVKMATKFHSQFFLCVFAVSSTIIIRLKKTWRNTWKDFLIENYGLYVMNVDVIRLNAIDGIEVSAVLEEFFNKFLWKFLLNNCTQLDHHH